MGLRRTRKFLKRSPSDMKSNVLLYSAEYILTVTGAGATAQSETDWHDVWKNSEEAQKVQVRIDTIHAEGRTRPPPQALQRSEFATSWLYQLTTLIRREAQDHWRNPTFLLAKMALNIGAGLLIGFTFFKSKDTIQGTQNKLFVRYHFLRKVLILLVTRLSSSVSFQVSLWVNNLPFPSSRLVRSTKPENVPVECTVGLHCLCLNSLLRHLGISSVPLCSSFVGIGRSVSRLIVVDTPISCMVFSRRYTTRPLARYGCILSMVVSFVDDVYLRLLLLCLLTWKLLHCCSLSSLHS